MCLELMFPRILPITVDGSFNLHNIFVYINDKGLTWYAKKLDKLVYLDRKYETWTISSQALVSINCTYNIFSKQKKSER